MTNLSEQDLVSFLNQNNNRFTNSAGMEIMWSEKWGILTYFTLCTYEEGPLEIRISTAENSLQEFISGFRLKKIEDIDHLNYTNAWMRYLNGAAEIIITPMELEVALSFKIVRSNTIIFSMDLHFYDEVPRHLTMPEDFEEYINYNDHKLYAANSNRYKFTKG